MRCTYVLPDGVTHTKGYVKDVNEARRYLDVKNMTSVVMGKEGVDNRELKHVDRSKVDLTKNVDAGFAF